MARLVGEKKAVGQDLKININKLLDELQENDYLDVSIATGIIEVAPKDGWAQWETVPSQKTITIKVNGGAGETRL